MKHYFIGLLILTLFIPNKMLAYKVFPSSGHQCKDQMLNKVSYSFVAENADGIWGMPWNVRSEYLSPDDFCELLGNFKNKEVVVEINDTHVNWQDYSDEPVQLKVALNCGAIVNTIMAYNEGINGSVLTQENIDKFKKRYGDKYAIISNVRRWTDESPKVFKQLDGISFEFQVPEKNEGIWSDVADAMVWAHENNKYIYLLTPPGHNNYHLNNQYLEGYKRLFEYLLETVGEEVLRSDKVIFAPANYNITKTRINMTPESLNGDYANTVMGVAKWLLDKDLYK